MWLTIHDARPQQKLVCGAEVPKISNDSKARGAADHGRSMVAVRQQKLLSEYHLTKLEVGLAGPWKDGRQIRTQLIKAADHLWVELAIQVVGVEVMDPAIPDLDILILVILRELPRETCLLDMAHGVGGKQGLRTECLPIHQKRLMDIFPQSTVKCGAGNREDTMKVKKRSIMGITNRRTALSGPKHGRESDLLAENEQTLAGDTNTERTANQEDILVQGRHSPRILTMGMWNKWGDQYRQMQHK